MTIYLFIYVREAGAYLHKC